MPEQNKAVPFGFKDVARDQKDILVGKVFAAVAPQYDLMNDLMSAGIHRFWKDFMVGQISPQPNLKILDVAGGTGDIAFRMAKKFQDAEITLCDINPEMLEVGKQRAKSKLKLASAIKWICGDACALTLNDQSYDVYTIAFGLRNVTDIKAALSQAYRVLQPGGQFLCLEFSTLTHPFLRELYKKYSFKVIPKIGQLVAQNKPAYQYLVESIDRFPNQNTIATMMREVGFEQVKFINLTAGVAALHIGWRI